MSRVILFFILSISFNLNNECHIQFKDFFNYSVPELIEYDYREHPYNQMGRRFFIIHELEYDTSNCNFEFIFDHSVRQIELEELLSSYYISIDSNICVLTQSSHNTAEMIGTSRMQVNDSLLSTFGSTLYIENPKDGITGDDVWVTAQYNNGKTLISICGDNKPIILFPEDR